MTYRVLILEDDPMVAAIDRQYVESDRHFQVVQVCKSGGQALEYLAHQDVELIVLDYYTPEMNGQEFLNHLHAMGRAPAVIMVTSASDTDIVRSLLSRGVQDYLVKPFEFARFRQALDRFLQRQKLLSNSGGMDQRAIDQLLQSQDGEESAPQLSKGLNGATLRLIQDFLARSQGQALTSEEIAEQVHLSRITIRRYVNYMVETGELVSSIDYQTGGRPSIRYRYTANLGAAGQGATKGTKRSGQTCTFLLKKGVNGENLIQICAQIARNKRSVCGCPTSGSFVTLLTKVLQYVLKLTLLAEFFKLFVKKTARCLSRREGAGACAGRETRRYFLCQR